MANIYKETDPTDRTGVASGGVIGPTSSPHAGISVVTKSVGGAPSATVKLQGSMDGVTAWTDIAGASEAITTAATTNVVPDAPMKWFPYYRWTISAITDITVDSITIWVAGWRGVDGIRDE